MSHGKREQRGARYLAEEQALAQQQQTQRQQPSGKRRVIVNTGAYGNRIVPAMTTLADAAAAHAGVNDPELFVVALRSRFEFARI